MDQYVEYAQPGNHRGFSHRLWKDCPLHQLLVGDPGVGWAFFDDFIREATGLYTETQATAGAFALTDAAGGVAEADSGSTTQHQGITVQKPGELFIPQSGSKIWMEARFKVDVVSTPPQVFIGLSEEDTTLIASGANSSTNHIGFESIADAGVDVKFVTEKAGSRGALDDITALEADTYIKLGFRVTETGKIEVYINGEKYATLFEDSDDIPIVEMTPSLVCQTDGTTQPKLYIDWWCFAQELLPTS